MQERTCICIDLKSFYASVECAARGLDPLKACLLVADASRTDKTICLAVSPALKAMGVSSRPRLFEAKQAIRLYEAAHHTRVDYITAVPRMAEYIRVSSEIYAVYRKYIAEDDIHVYSIDECFMDVTPYLHLYRDSAAAENISPARFLAMAMVRDVLASTGITATVGIGTNLYLAKVAMDIVAKKSPPDLNGVRIAELDEEDYRVQLWSHRPLTDFWQIGPGTARRLITHGMRTMGDIAAVSQSNEELLYRLFGVNAELLIDHAWGIEPTLMSDIKAYRSASHSLSAGQVLPRPYRYDEALVIFREMADGLAADLVDKHLQAAAVVWWVSFDPVSLEACPDYTGPVCVDFYGRLHPAHAGGTVRFPVPTNSVREIRDAAADAFRRLVNPALLARRIMLCAEDVRSESSTAQLDLFTDYAARERELHLQRAMLSLRKKYGRNILFKGMNLLEGATAMERNRQIGGHRA
jgi:DNA polymerase V